MYNWLFKLLKNNLDKMEKKSEKCKFNQSNQTGNNVIFLNSAHFLFSLPLKS